MNNDYESTSRTTIPAGSTVCCHEMVYKTDCDVEIVETVWEEIGEGVTGRYRIDGFEENDLVVIEMNE